MHYIFLICCFVIMASGCSDNKKLPDLRESYSSRETAPFGAYAAKRLAESAIPGKKVSMNRRSFSKHFSSSNDTNAIYFSISRNLFVTEEDAQAMVDYVYAGNTLFLSAAQFDTILLQKLLCEQERTITMDILQLNYANTRLSLDEKLDPSKEDFKYYYKPFVNSFSSIKVSYNHVIAYNSSGKPNSFILFWGKGRLILHCDPRAFSNYFLLQDNNYRYFQKLLRVAGTPAKIYWDDYYRNQNVRRQGERKFSALNEILKHPSLAISFWIFVLMLALFVLFGSKRLQRVIPVIKKNENSSVAFTETIARLYLQHHDNKNIADKMVTYFHEFIRNKYFLSATSGTDFIHSLSRKSGVPFGQTESLYHTIEKINNLSRVDDRLLLDLNTQIHEFYKNRN